MATEGETIKEIRTKIPSFKCKEGCHDCCGPIPFSEWEWEQVKNKKEATSIHCPYIGDNGCEIYEDRPMVCRLFGVIERMKCPHGCKPLLGYMPLIVELHLMTKYLKYMFEGVESGRL